MIGKKAKCACGKVIRIGKPADHELADHELADGGDVSTRSSRPSEKADSSDLRKSLDPPPKNTTNSSSSRESNSPTKRKKKRRRKKLDVPTVDVEKKRSSAIDYQYNDLDALLAGDPVATPEQRPEFSEDLKASDFEDALETIPTDRPANDLRAQNTRSRAAVRPAVSGRSSIHESLGLEVAGDGEAQAAGAGQSNTSSTLALLSAICSSTLGFWFGLLIVLSRFRNNDQFLLRDFTEMIRDINAGRFGTESMAAELQTGFGVVGWIIWSVALLMMILSAGQFANAILQLFYRRQVLGWVDGLMAAAGITFVFLAFITLFLHSTHVTNLKRKLTEQANQDIVGESNPAHVSLIADRYDERSKKFITVMLLSSVVPMTIFVLCMIRLFLSTGESRPAGRRLPNPAT
jgi:cytochrome c oxidase subunit IV